MARDTEFFVHAGSQVLRSDLAGAAWPVFKDFEVERTDDDVFIYAPARLRPSKVKQVYSLGEGPPDENLERHYAPLRDKPDLFLRFASLARKDALSTDGALQVMLEWATTHGVLGTASFWHWESTRADYPRTRRESLRSFAEAVREAARCLELYRAATVLDGEMAEAVLDRYRASGSTLREKQEWALICSGDIVGAWVEGDCYTRLLRTVKGEKNSKARFWYEKRTLGFEQGWGFRSLLGAMYLQMMFHMTGRADWKPCKRPHCYGRVILKSGTEGERRTPSHKEFCSKACKVWWSENYGENNAKAKAKRNRQVG